MYLLLLLFLIFLWQVYEDYQNQSISLSLMIISILLTLFMTYKLIMIYTICSLIYFIGKKTLQKHLGFGDIWYLVLFFFYFSRYYYLLLLNLWGVLLWGTYTKTSKTLPLLPLLLMTITMGIAGDIYMTYFIKKISIKV